MFFSLSVTPVVWVCCSTVQCSWSIHFPCLQHDDVDSAVPSHKLPSNRCRSPRTVDILRSIDCHKATAEFLERSRPVAPDDLTSCHINTCHTHCLLPLSSTNDHSSSRKHFQVSFVFGEHLHLLWHCLIAFFLQMGETFINITVCILDYSRGQKGFTHLKTGVIATVDVSLQPVFGYLHDTGNAWHRHSL